MWHLPDHSVLPEVVGNVRNGVNSVEDPDIPIRKARNKEAV
jgi:hypothetical protein